MQRPRFETWLTGSPDEAFDLLRAYPAERVRIVRIGQEKADDPRV